MTNADQEQQQQQSSNPEMFVPLFSYNAIQSIVQGQQLIKEGARAITAGQQMIHDAWNGMLLQPAEVDYSGVKNVTIANLVETTSSPSESSPATPQSATYSNTIPSPSDLIQTSSPPAVQQQQKSQPPTKQKSPPKSESKQPRKKQRKERKPTAKYINAYLLFSTQKRKELTQEELKAINADGNGEHGGKPSDVARYMGNLWKQMGEDEKKVWTEKAKELNEKYKAEFDLQQTSGSQSPAPESLVEDEQEQEQDQEDEEHVPSDVITPPMSEVHEETEQLQQQQQEVQTQKHVETQQPPAQSTSAEKENTSNLVETAADGADSTATPKEQVPEQQTVSPSPEELKRIEKARRKAEKKQRKRLEKLKQMQNAQNAEQQV
ncbi:hypothetical protein MP228_003150 [Amoeboaphelidium protococcarum]|nr:hypothetical protein MP228_003150 [Amoeboaphelidium protococcarum]